MGDKLSQESGYFNEVLKTNWPYYGHSNGCMWERPYIEPRLCSDDEIFEENMVASVEGFYTHEGVGTAVFRDQLHRHRRRRRGDHARCLTSSGRPRQGKADEPWPTTETWTS